MTAIDVRPLRRDEYEAWLPLWQGYLTFYEASVPDAVTAVTWARFHDVLEPMTALGAFADGGLLGIAHYHVQRSTWAPMGYVYLEDLFTVPEARGRGAGRALLAFVQRTASEMGASRLYWSTQTGNDTARALYDTIADVADFVQYRKPL